jgi:hypothetical protein
MGQRTREISHPRGLFTGSGGCTAVTRDGKKFPTNRGGHSGYPKISGRVIRVFKISGFENRYPKLQRVLQYPKIRVPKISGSGLGIPELPELLCRLHKNTYTLLN